LAATVIDIRNVTKVFRLAANARANGDGFAALKGIDLQVQQGEFVGVIGKSGSGKSTLLNLLAGIDLPTTGEIYVSDVAVHRLNQDQGAVWRRRNIGLIFQFFQLLPTLTILENVMLPMDFSGGFPSSERKHRARQLLERLDIEAQAEKLPASLSGGEQQRAAMARALANDPPILLADEPTGNLDSETAESVLQLFQNLAANNKTIVMVTHERDITGFVSRTISLANGRVS